MWWWRKPRRIQNKKITEGTKVQSSLVNLGSSGTKVINNWWDKNDIRQTWLQYLLDNWGEDAMRTFLAENWTMWLTRKSDLVWSNGYRDYWICQINAWYHSEILWWWGNYWSWKYFAEWFYDPYKQMDKCIDKFKWWTKFYAYPYRYERTKSIIVY